MRAGTGQWPSFTGLGGQAHLAAPFARLLARLTRRRAWDRFERAITSGTGPEIRAAREHLKEVSR